MSEANSQTAISVAIIGAVGVVAGSLFTNWDKVFAPRNPSVQPPGHSSVAIAKDGSGQQELPQESELKTVIRDQWIKGSEGQPKEVSFQNFSIGLPYLYRSVDPLSGGSPDGDGGRKGDTVFPVRTTFTVRETFPGKISYSQRTRDFSCFLDSWRSWKCNVVGGGFETKSWSTPNRSE